jgi:Protocatechuate 3,4-dioxygenase beta subunit N terminal
VAQPRLDYPPHRSSRLRHPRSSFVCVDPDEVDPLGADRSVGNVGEPIEERIIAACEPGPNQTVNMVELACTPGQTIEPFFDCALRYAGLEVHPAQMAENHDGAKRIVMEYR